LYEESASSGDGLVVANLALVKRVALHLHARVPRFVEVEDLVQAGMIGLIDAARAFDPAKGSNFEAFAYLRVRGAMFDEIRRLSYQPRSAVAINKAHAESANELSTQLGRNPTQVELAEFMQKDAESLQQERSRAIRFDTSSIDAQPELVENLSADDSSRPDVQVEASEFMEAVQQAITQLPERDQMVIQLYYVEEMTLKEIGAVIGVGESRVSQILSAAAKSLRRTLAV
jgi:RNA polymerase sigma factor for flagellar operon FliA